MKIDLGVKAWVFGIFGGFVVSMGWAAEPKVELTVYNSNLGLVRERRTLDLPNGKGEIRFTDVASQIDATSVLFKSLDDKNVVVLDQNYEYDLVNSDKLLKKYVDKSISVVTKGGAGTPGEVYEGTLLSFDGSQLVIKTVKGLAMVNRANIQDIRFESLPEGLITRPTLNWLLDGGKGGKQTCEIAYLTSGINWRCDYTVVVSDDDKVFKDFGGWVTVTNNSGAAYRDAKLKLIAGDVNRVQAPVPQAAMAFASGAVMMDKKNGFAERSFFEYHLYSLGRPVTVKENQIKQEELLTARDVPVTKLYEYDGAQKPKVVVKIEFKNDEKSQLGMPLPLGRVRVYKEDKVGKSLEFIGEDNLDHTPKDEKRRLTMGNAFDLVGERKQTDMKQIGDRMQRHTYEIKLRNHKEKEAVTINVIEHFWAEWDILREKVLVGKKDAVGQLAEVNAVKKDARTAEWAITIPADGEAVLTYTVEQRW